MALDALGADHRRENGAQRIELREFAGPAPLLEIARSRAGKCRGHDGRGVSRAFVSPGQKHAQRHLLAAAHQLKRLDQFRGAPRQLALQRLVALRRRSEPRGQAGLGRVGDAPDGGFVRSKRVD